MRSEPCGFQSVICLQILAALYLYSLPFAAQTHSASSTGISSLQKAEDAPGRISGHIYRADTGQPLFDAVVSLIPQGTMGGRFPEARTGADGNFDFSVVAPGDYTVEASAEDFVSGSYDKKFGSEMRPYVIAISSGQRVDGIVIRLDPAGSISGTVYDETGKPADNVMVLAIRPRFEPGGREDVSGGDGRTVDDDGDFLIAGLRPGSYLVRAGGPFSVRMGEGYRYRETYYPGTDLLENAQLVQVIAGRDTGGIRISVKTETTYKIIGTISDPHSSGHRRYEIEVSEPDSVRVPICCNPASASSGQSFTTGGIPRGDYIVSVAAIEAAQTTSGWTVIGRGYARISVRDGDAHVNVEVGDGGEVRGKVSIEGRSGSIPRSSLLLRKADGSNTNLFSELIDADGEVDMRDIPPGAYRFAVALSPEVAYLKEVHCSGSDHTYDPLEIDLNDVVTDCEFILGSDAGSIRGNVLFEDRSTPGMVVVLIPEKPELRQLEGYVQSVRTGPGGQFQMTGVIPGRYFVFASPLSEDQAYYAPGFVDEKGLSAQRLTILPRDHQIILVHPSTLN